MRSINPFDGAVDIPTVASEGFFALVQDPSERWEETDIAATTENYRTHTDGHNAATGNHPNQQSGFNSLGGETNIQSNSNSVFLFEDYLYFPDDVDIGSRTQSPVHDCNPAEALPDVIDGCFQGTDQLSASGEARGNTRQRASVNSPTFLATASTASVTFMAIASSNNEATETEGMALDAPTPKEPQSPATPQPPDNDDLYDLDDIGQLSPPLKPMKVTLQPSPSPSPAVRLPRYKGISKGDSVLISFMSGGKHLQTPSSTRPSGESAAVPDEDDIPELDISHPVAQPILSGTEQGESSKAESNIPRSQLFYEPPVYICPFCTDRDHKYPRPANLQRHVRVHHVDSENDPGLREVLSRRPENPARGRRCSAGYLENLERKQAGESGGSPIATPHLQQKGQPSSFLEADGNNDNGVVQESAIGSTKMGFIMKDALREESINQQILDESDNNMPMNVNDTIDPRLLEAYPSTSYPYSGQDGTSPIATRTQHVLPGIEYDNGPADIEVSEAEIAEPSRARNSSYPQTSSSSTPKEQYHCSHCPRVFPTRGRRTRHERQHTKPARCQHPGCCAAFAEQRDLARHQLSIHSHRDEREPCTHAGCDGSFSRHDSLLRHVRKQHDSNNSHGS